MTTSARSTRLFLRADVVIGPYKSEFVALLLSIFTIKICLFSAKNTPFKKGKNVLWYLWIGMPKIKTNGNILT